MQPNETLIVKAAELARSSPQRWQEFLQALAAYTDKQRDILLKSPLPDLPNNQGRAQSLAMLYDTLGNATANADKIKAKNP